MFWGTFSSVKMLCVITIGSLFTFLLPQTGKSSVLKFKAPNLTDEEMHSKFIPDNLTCDACQAIAHQLFDKFEDFNRLHKHYNYNLPESELIELLESSCTRDVFDRYGVKSINGINRLNGPGVKDTDKVPGMISGGGKWPGRLAEMCGRYVENLGEEAIYKAFVKHMKSREGFFEYLCLGKSSEGRSSCKRVRYMEKEL